MKKTLAIIMVFFVTISSISFASSFNSMLVDTQTSFVGSDVVEINTFLSNGKEVTGYKALTNSVSFNKASTLSSNTLRNQSKYAIMSQGNKTFAFNGSSSMNSNAKVNGVINYSTNGSNPVGSTLKVYGGYTDGYWAGSPTNPDQMTIFQKYTATSIGVAINVSAPPSLSFSGSAFNQYAEWKSSPIYNHYLLTAPHENVEAWALSLPLSFKFTVEDGADIYLGSQIYKARATVSKKWEDIFY